MKKVLLLLANGFEMYEASVFIDVIGWNLCEGDGSTELVTCGLTREVSTSFGQKVIPNLQVDEVIIDEFEALAIPGGFEEYGFYQDAYSEKFLDVIRNFHQKNKTVASICVAALPVGKCGLLTGYNGTTFMGARRDQLREFGVNVLNEPLVIDNNIITSWNPSTAISVAIKLLELLTSPENAQHIERIMGFRS